MKHNFHPSLRRYAILKMDIETNIKERSRPQGEVFHLKGFHNKEYDPNNPYADPALAFNTCHCCDEMYALHYSAFGLCFGNNRPDGFGDTGFTSGEGFFYDVEDEEKYFDLYCPAHDLDPECCGCLNASD